MLLGGALRGRSPRTREGRLGPTAQKTSGQWSEEGLALTEIGKGVEGRLAARLRRGGYSPVWFKARRRIYIQRRKDSAIYWIYAVCIKHMLRVLFTRQALNPIVFV